MRKIFITLYITLGITTIFAVFSIAYIYKFGTYSLELKEESDEFRGTFNLLTSQIERYPENSWPSKIKELRNYFDFPVKLVNVRDVVIAEKYRKDFMDGSIVSEPNNVNVLYKRLKKSDHVISIGPLPEFENKGLINSVMMISFLMILSVPVFIWSLLLWKDLRKVEKTSNSFGKGNMSARVGRTTISAVSDLAQTFDSMAEKISYLIISHKDLTNAVSHELRTPVSRIKFELEMLKYTEDNISRDRYIDGIERDISEIEKLLDQMLSFAKYDREPEKEFVTPNKIIPFIENLINNEKKEHGKKLILTINENMKDSLIDFDPDRMNWAIGNLVRNAVKFSESNVYIILEREGTLCKIHVDDDGPGIPEDKRERIFEPFYRLESSRNKKFGGYGLGLAIVWKVIKWHGGDVKISSSVYGGARFTITLPFHSENSNINNP